MSTKITYHYFEGDHEQHVRDVIAPWIPFLPHWLLRLRIRCQGKSEDGEHASVDPCPDYRCATINLFYEFYDRDISEQRQIMLHEIVHIHHWTFISWVRRLLLAPLKDENPRLYDAMWEEARTRSENMACDVTESLVSLVEVQSLANQAKKERKI